MAPRATTTEPPALAIEPIDDAAVEASWICKILMQFKTPKGVTCSVLSKPMWPRIDGLPERVAGRVDQWVVTKNKTMRISWQEANGEFKYDIDTTLKTYTCSCARNTGSSWSLGLKARPCICEAQRGSSLRRREKRKPSIYR